MLHKRVVGLVAALGVLVGPGAVAGFPAQASSPEDQKKLDELMASARSHQNYGEWAARGAFLFAAVALVWAAISTYRNGLKISEGKRIEGTPAKVIATILVLAAVGLGVVGFVYASVLIP